jgi:hypothetical protein
MNDSSSTIPAGEQDLRVLTLIRGEEYVVLCDSDANDVPDRDAFAELRIHAYQCRNKETLGAIEHLQTVVDTVALYAAQGTIGGAAWAAFPAVGRYIQRWRSKERSQLADEELPPLVRRVTAGLLGKPVLDLRITAQGRIPEGNGWLVEACADGQDVRLTIEGSGRLISGRVLDASAS